MGGSNIHIPLVCDDGVKWLARIRKVHCYTPPAAFSWINADSEAATLHALSTAGLRVPDAWRCPTDPAGRLQLPCLFETHLEGKAQAHTIQYEHCRPLISDQVAEVRKKVMDSLADWHLDLEKITFHRVGSMSSAEGDASSIGPEMTRQPLGETGPSFPSSFPNVKERNLAIVDHFLQLAAGGETYNPRVAVHAYLVFKDVREWVNECREMEKGPWLVMHGEPKGDHFLFDTDWNVTGAIDWEWARTSSKNEVFHAPLFYRSTAFWQKGLNDPSRWEQDNAAVLASRGRAALEEIVLRTCRKHQRLDQLFRCGPGNLPIHNLNALQRSFANLPDSFAEQQPRSVQEWVGAALTKLRGDPVLDELLRAAAAWDFEETTRKEYALNKQRTEAPARIGQMKERSAAIKEVIF